MDMDEQSELIKSPQKLTDDELEDWQNDDMKEESVEIDSDIDNDNEQNILSIANRKKKLKKGDYVIQVHVIEARNLKGRDMNAMSDPVVNVQVMNQTKSSEIKKKCSNAVWDQVLFFEFKDLDKQEINEGKCKISVFDANTIMRNVLIGSYEFDLASVYFNNEYHEVYKQWLGLFDVTDKHEGIQGYLRVSIVVLGPNDEQKTHKLIDEDEDETNLLSVLLPPEIEQIPYLLSIRIFECRNLCTSDVGFFSDACDPFAIVEFGSIKIKSKVKKGVNVDMLCELHVPVMEPIMSQSIKIQFMDWNGTKRNDRIASLSFDYSQIKHQINGPDDKYGNPKWYPLYGAPSGYQRGIARRMNQGFIEGTSYRGEALLSLSVTKQEKRPKKGIVDISISSSDKPDVCPYVITMDLYEGSEIHKMKSLMNNQMYVEVCCGRHSAKSKRVNVKDGRCEWFQVIVENVANDSAEQEFNLGASVLKASVLGAANAASLFQAQAKNKDDNKDGFFGPIVMPEDVEQCPDIFIYLCSNNKRISYLRLPFKDIYEKGWKNGPKWYNLKEDKAVNALDENIFPGSLLLAINCGRTDQMPFCGYSKESRPFMMEQMDEYGNFHRNSSLYQGKMSAESPMKQKKSILERQSTPKKLPSIGTLTVYIQQAQALPAMDKNGKSDPFLKLKIYDKRGNLLTAESSIVFETLNPKWYQCFTFENIPIGETLKINLFDYDSVGFNDSLGFVEILLVTQSNRPAGVNWDVKHWFFVNDKHPDAKLQCRLKFEFLSIEECDELNRKSFNFSNTLRRSVGLSSTKTNLPSCCAFGAVQKKSMQLRCHLFQARNLIATDANGLCDPYVVIRCCGQTAKSQIVEKSIDPQWYETLILNILLPDQVEIAPDIHIQVFDHDQFSRDDVVGRFIMKPSEIRKDEDSERDFKAQPTWYNLRDADCRIIPGEILMDFRLVVVSACPVNILPSLRPVSDEKWIQIIALGMRELKSTMGGKPYIKFRLNDKSFKTNGSNLPSNTNPNFLQVVKMKVALPHNPLYAPSLRLSVKEALFGGMIKRALGNASVSIQDLIENPYMFKREIKKREDEDEEEDDEKKEKLENEEEQKYDDSDMTTESVIIEMEKEKEIDDIIDSVDENLIKEEDEEMKQQILERQESATSTSDLVKHLTEIYEDDDISRDEKSEDSFDLDAEQKVDMSEDVPEYMVGRRRIDDELEDAIEMNPFLAIPVFTGQVNSKINKYRKIGYFKGLVEMTNTKKTSELKIKKKINVQQLLNPTHLFIRLYILRGVRLTPKDSDGTCDPYLVIKFGKNYKVSTRSRAIKNTLNPEFYEAFEIPCTIPGASELTISVWDWDGIGDDLVGTTVIDIEDRWFSNSWHKLGKIKPLEIRTLRSHQSSFPQGKIEMWMEILTDVQMKREPILDITPPQPQPHELRVIIWECKNVTIKDEITQMNDLFVTGCLEGGEKKIKKQETDLHFRSQKGYGSFNWRMKFPIDLPSKKPPRFRIQIWDKDFFSVNDSICEAYLSLAGIFKLCTKKNDRVVMKFRGKDKFWLNDLTHPNFEGNQGKIKISIECMPMHIAHQLPAGHGRSAPNTNPFLPEPKGRAQFSIFSPFQSLRNLLGDQMVWKLVAGFVFSAVTSFLVLIGPTLVSTLLAKSITHI